MDIDFLLRNETMQQVRLEKMLNNIVQIVLEDNIKYSIDDCKQIKPDDEYGGYSFKIVGTLDNIRLPFWVDIATGDPVTPSVYNYQYKTLLTNELLSIPSYPIETILAEKLETIVSKRTSNSRSKDFYDIYIIAKVKLDKIDMNLLKQACYKTFTYRNTSFRFKDIIVVLDMIKEEPGFVSRWKNYAVNNPFATGINFEDTLHEVYNLVDLLFEKELILI